MVRAVFWMTVPNIRFIMGIFYYYDVKLSIPLTILQIGEMLGDVEGRVGITLCVSDEGE